MADYEDLRTALRWLLLSQLSPMPRYMRGLLGNGQGKIAVPDRPGFCYVRPSHTSDDTIEVFNKEVSGGDGTPVLVGELPWQPGLTQIVSVDWETYIQVGWGDGYAGVALHGSTHEWRDGFVGTDAFNVHRRQIAPMRTYPVGSGSHSVNIAPYDYIYAGSPVSWCGLPGLDLSPAVPATGTARLMLTYLDMESNVAGVVTGSLDVDSDAVELSRPALPTGTWAPSAYVRLYGGQPGILEPDISDARQLWAGMSATPSGPAGGDLTGSYPNPIVIGLNDYPLRDTTPAEGYGLMYTGSAWSPIPWPAGGGGPTGPAGGDLTGSYPNPLVVGIFGDPIDTGVSPAEGDALIFSASGTNYWRPADHYLLRDGSRAMTGELEADLGISIPTGQELKLDDDEDTGIICPSPYDDHIRFNIAGTEEIDFYVTGVSVAMEVLTEGTTLQIWGLSGGTRRLMIDADPDDTVQLLYNGGARFGTTADGVYLATTGLRIDLDTDTDTSIRASADDVITFEASGADQVHIADGAIYPDQDNDIDLGTASIAFKDVWILGSFYLDTDSDSYIHSAADDQITFDIAGTDVGYFEADGLNIEGRILKTVWFFPALESEYTTGQYFNDNDASYPAGWTEDDAASATNTNTLYGFWYLVGSQTETSWQYSYDTSFDLENDAGANAWTTWLFGPAFWRDGSYTADLDYTFGVHGSTGGVMDANTYNRIRLHWDQATSVWQVRGESRAGAADSETATAYSTLTFPLHQPLWFAVVVRNNATKTCRNYIGTSSINYTQSLFSNVAENTTWGNLHLVLSMSRGAGIGDVLYMGMWDSRSAA